MASKIFVHSPIFLNELGKLLFQAKDLDKKDKLDIVRFSNGGIKISKQNLNISIRLENKKSMRNVFNPSTYKLIDFVLCQADKQGYPEWIIVNRDEYLKYFGKTNRNRSDKTLKEDLSVIESMKITFKSNFKNQNCSNLQLIDSIDYGGSTNITLRLNDEFYKMVKNSHNQPLCLEMFSLNNKTDAYVLTRKMLNDLKQNPKRGKLKVETLLNYSPLLPTFLQVKNSNRNYTQRIIRPFLKTLNEVDGLMNITLIDLNGTARKIEEAEKINYFELTQWYVSFKPDWI